MTQIEGEVEIPGFGTVDIQDSALQVQDQRNQSHWLYKMMAGIVALAHFPVIGKALQPHTGVLAILLLSIVIKVALTPLTKKSFRSMREMQKLQPLMKDLQQRYRDKPQELQKRTMELYQEHGVNPLSGCLPMLLQMPIIILLWRAIALYQYPLSQESFLWIKSLAVADVPLALIYAASLYASSKLTMMPAADLIARTAAEDDGHHDAGHVLLPVQVLSGRLHPGLVLLQRADNRAAVASDAVQQR